MPTPAHLWRNATRLGQKCRDLGVNVGSLDLIIATCALDHDAEIITFDADYQAIALASPLRVVLLSRDVE